MIIKGGARKHRYFWSKHVANRIENDQVRVVEIRGLSSDNIAGCFREMEAMNIGNRTKNFFYHASINPEKGVELTPEQWDYSANLLEEKLGLSGQVRFIVEHQKKGRTHRHVFWYRVNPFTRKAIPYSHNYKIHSRVAEQLTQELGLSKVPRRDLGEVDRDERNLKSWEVFRGQKSGIDALALKKKMTALWDKHKDGKALITAIEKRGFILARGDKQRYCIVDQVGNPHSLARQIKGARVADIRERLSDRALEDLPHVDEVAAYQRSAHREIEREEGDKVLFQSRDEQEKDFEKQVKRQKAQLEEIQEQKDRIKSYEADLKKQAQEREELEKGKKKGRDIGDRSESGGIRDARERYMEALSGYNMADPYGSLSRAASQEHAMLMKERHSLDQRIASEQDPDKKQKLQLQKDIEANEYMALTDRRCARMSEVTHPRGKDSPYAKELNERADQFEQRAQALRQEHKALSQKIERDSQRPAQQQAKQSIDVSKYTKRAADMQKDQQQKAQRTQQPTPLNQSKADLKRQPVQQSSKLWAKTGKPAQQQAKQSIDVSKYTKRAADMQKDQQQEAQRTQQPAPPNQSKADLKRQPVQQFSKPWAKTGKPAQQQPKPEQTQRRELPARQQKPPEPQREQAKAQPVRQANKGVAAKKPSYKSLITNWQGRDAAIKKVRQEKAQQNKDLKKQDIAAAKLCRDKSHAQALRETLPAQQQTQEKRQEPQQQAKQPSLKVVDRAAKGKEENLQAYVKSLPEKPAERHYTREEARSNPEAKRAMRKQKLNQENRSIALNRIAIRMKGKKPLDTKDIKLLSRDDLKGIKEKGDKHMQHIIKEHQQAREREKSQGLER